jgi:hypothetical protein
VVIYLQGGVVLLTMRVSGVDVSPDLGGYIAGKGAVVGADQVILIRYTAAESRMVERSVTAGVVGELEQAGLHVKDALEVVGSRYWSLLCDDDTCCPAEGTEFDHEASPLEASRVLSGQRAVLASREGLQALYVARPDLCPTQAALEKAWAEESVPVGVRAYRCWRAVKRLRKGRLDRSAPSERLVARLIVSMQDVRVRDYVLARIALSDGPIDGYVDVLVQAAVASPEPLRARLAGAAAMALLSAGESSIAVDCLTNMAGRDSLARLVASAQSIPVAPDVIRRLLCDALPEVMRRIREADAQ